MKMTVVTVCLDSAMYIEDCLRSVDEQREVDVEHLVIDGGSTDGTLEVLDRYQRPWRQVVSERDGGMYEAMNKGIRLATGAVVGFLNSDDFYASSEVLRDVMAAFSDSRVDACWGDLTYVARDNASSEVRRWVSSEFEPGLFARGWSPPHPTFFVRAEIYAKFGGFRTQYRMGNDVELMARLLEQRGIVGRYLPQTLVRMRAGGVSNRNLRSVVLQNRELLRAFRDLGMRVSATEFVLCKIMSRTRQFLGARL
jgi:glycosyltransferase involved in cell wall biosynthesis